VLTMRFIDDLSIGEIAETIGVSENVVSVRIHRGVARLRTLCNI
jgi:DNA-directed RNA polymerase specialized sigma24 family protein